MNLHQTRDFGKLEDCEKPSEMVDAIDLHFAGNQEILTELFNRGYFTRTYRAGKVHPEKDEYGRVLFNRVRIKVDVSDKCFVELRSREEIGYCECDPNQRELSTMEPFPDNPDLFYCKGCKKLVERYS